jgi:7-methyl-GTP pyrophosphatase
MPPRLILASTSAYRKAQLEKLQLSFECLAPDVNEESLKSVVQNPRELALRLAVEKAKAIARNHPRAVVIGGDQLVFFRGDVLGKPLTRENAVQQLMRLAGQQHALITAVAVCHRGHCQTHVDETRLWMRPIDRETAVRYVLSDQPLDCAGSYKIESLGISLFDRIETQDHTAITGLPLLAITKLLNSVGIAIP